MQQKGSQKRLDRTGELGYRCVRVDSLRILVQWSDTSVSTGQCDAKLGLLAIRLLPPASELYGCGGFSSARRGAKELGCW